MSILIASIDHLNRVVYMAADHRSMNIDGAFEGDGITKIITIREGIFYGMSGLASEGLRMKAFLLDNKYLPASELINLAENFTVRNTEHNGETHGATFVIAGVYDDGKPFIWSKNSYEKKEDVPEDKGGHYLEAETGSLVREPAICMSAPKQSTINAVKPNFTGHVIATGSYADAMFISIQDAAKIDKAISGSCDLHMFDTATMKGFSRTIGNRELNHEN